MHSPALSTGNFFFFFYLDPKKLPPTTNKHLSRNVKVARFRRVFFSSKKKNIKPSRANGGKLSERPAVFPFGRTLEKKWGQWRNAGGRWLTKHLCWFSSVSQRGQFSFRGGDSTVGHRSRCNRSASISLFKLPSCVETWITRWMFHWNAAGDLLSYTHCPYSTNTLPNISTHSAALSAH